ncbi:50S ribosomal protein L17 [Desulfosudis oleivorans]|uniref:Large ribosomal subunit protein bL17 n=1 Tax=Desulfosudis oleivorans (strain DSM 6200 / JCM 39069 / Hxd3) TaxID=96561 RepID=RL17_DESOH|nr:50S ribosomal protein L17 [Desulfosudis oleivorans]A8ZV83.1 RecName: Full=Large ribosomal subunit protein bL17; AltName: Full=50S ribosomal protein L17 [Desulfosudis oleivorans Hxd3]ABW66544.1 ribosomal protein L17 [Desulfosudis oleivorans Hxd3]
MRHRKSGVKLGRTGSHRNAMFRNMVTSLLKHEKIQTTDAKAKELRRWADHVITLAKRGDLHARRQVMAIVREKNVVHKLFAEAAERFGSREGGYTRLTKIGARPGDAAPVTLIELVSLTETTEKKKKKPAKTAAKPAPTPSAPAVEKEAAADTPAPAAEESAPAKAAEPEAEAAAPEAEAAPEEPEVPAADTPVEDDGASEEAPPKTE